jgi:predicted AAA+ superfamily ATPase
MFPRHITPLLMEALADTPVVLINGARRTGKSTLAQMLAETSSRRYLTLDDATTLNAVRADPVGFVAGLSNAVVIDEIQRAPELFLAIKAAVDRDHTGLDRAGRFLLTGSANVLLLPALADSLAGRMEIIHLLPLSCAEQEGMSQVNYADVLFNGSFDRALPRYDRAMFIETLLAGGFPEAVARTSARRRDAWFASFLEAVLQRDVRDLA